MNDGFADRTVLVTGEAGLIGSFLTERLVSTGAQDRVAEVIEAPEGGSIELSGDGSQQRGFIFVTDLVDGMIQVLTTNSDGQPTNLGNSEEEVSIRELAEKIIEISGKNLSLAYDRSKPTGTDRYACDMTKMKDELDWEPSVPLDVGLTEVYQWARTGLEATLEATVSADGGSS